MTNPAVGENDKAAEAFLALLDARRGHFQLESGHHGELWLDLDALFARPRRVAPLVALLADALRPYEVAGVCGPLVGGAFLAQATAAALDVEFAFTERVMPAAPDGLYPALYRLPPAFAPRVRGRRIAIVDDVMSAGSAARGTYSELRVHEAGPAVVGALLFLGSTGADFFLQNGVAVEAVARRPYRLWLPAACPLRLGRIARSDVPARRGLSANVRGIADARACRVHSKRNGTFWMRPPIEPGGKIPILRIPKSLGSRTGSRRLNRFLEGGAHDQEDER